VLCGFRACKAPSESIKARVGFGMVGSAGSCSAVSRSRNPHSLYFVTHPVSAGTPIPTPVGPSGPDIPPVFGAVAFRPFNMLGIAALMTRPNDSDGLGPEVVWGCDRATCARRDDHHPVGFRVTEVGGDEQTSPCPMVDGCLFLYRRRQLPDRTRLVVYVRKVSPGYVLRRTSNWSPTDKKLGINNEAAVAINTNRIVNARGCPRRRFSLTR
jgi:hypothetical protein